MEKVRAEDNKILPAGWRFFGAARRRLAESLDHNVLILWLQKQMRREHNEKSCPDEAAEASEGYRSPPLSAAPPGRVRAWLALPFYNGSTETRKKLAQRA